MSFGFGQSSELEAILKEGNTSLEDLMDRENFLYDIKAGGINAFADYIIKTPENYEKLISYLVITNDMINETTPENRLKKYPYIISEIFTLDHPKILEYLFHKHKMESQNSIGQQSNERLTTIEDDLMQEGEESSQDYEEEQQSSSEILLSGTSIKFIASQKSRNGFIVPETLRQYLLQTFFSLLEQDTINETVVGYYTKVLLSIVKRNGSEFWDHIMNNPYILEDLLKHICHQTFADIFVKLIILDYRFHDQVLINYKCYAQRKALVELIVVQIEESNNDVHNTQNLCRVISQILAIAIESPIYEQLRELFELMLKPQYFFDQAVLFVNIQKKMNLAALFQVTLDVIRFIQINKLQDVRVAQLIKLLQNAPAIIQMNLNKQLQSTAGMNITIFGSNNLILIQIIECIVKLHNPLLNEVIIQSDYVNLLLQLVIDFQWNNQLQILVIKIFDTLLSQEKMNSRIIKETQFINTLYKFIIEKPQQDLLTAKKKSEIKYGFTGCLKKIAYKIQSQQAIDPKFKKAINDMHSIHVFIEEMTKLNQIDAQPLCNIDPKTHMEEAPPEISIDRQIENLIDNQNQQKKKEAAE